VFRIRKILDLPNPDNLFLPIYYRYICISLPRYRNMSLKGLSHKMDLAFDDMFG
jgi:hypothetical protein